MAPVFKHLDFVCLHRSQEKMEAGRIVALRLADNKPPFLKRVIAVAGDRMEIRQNQICRNGQPVMKMAAHRKQPSILQRQLARYSNIVPPRNLIVLGDNAGQSYDSNDFGLVAISQVVGVINRGIGTCNR